MHTLEMIRNHPGKAGTTDTEAACIEACFDCAQTCIACADACLSERDLGMLVDCVRLNLNCAAVCQATGEVLSRQAEQRSTLVASLLRACIEACRLCAEECELHAMDHCRVCAEACRNCEAARRQALANNEATDPGPRGVI